MNWAAAFGLPILFVCEDNQWSATTRTDAMSAGGGAAVRARGFGVEALEVDGNDGEAVYRAAGAMVQAVRAGAGPRLLHAKTYRFKGHVSVDPAAYRDPAELAAAMKTDPLFVAREKLAARGVAASEIDALVSAARDEVAAALASARAAPFPDEAAATEEVQDTGAGQWL
jgi:TPP-dependent pyruvate/acetoin dehydrogenase alpha subunit